MSDKAPSPRKMLPNRKLCFEILTRMRESQVASRTLPFGSMASQYEAGRCRAFDECFTELKGRGYAEK